MEQWVHYSITIRREGKTDRLSYASVHGRGPCPVYYHIQRRWRRTDGPDTLNSLEHFTPQNSNGVGDSTVL
jgi:hypothetical protein